MRFRPFVIPSVVIIGSLSLIYVIVAPAIRLGNDSAHRSNCLSNLKHIAFAAFQYSQDNDGRFPALSRGEQGWADAFQAYTKSYTIFHCPTVGQPADVQFSDYFFNARLANLSRAQLPSPALTISFGDGIDNGATNSHLSELPLNWKTDADSPAKRHLDGANYAFVDGHVKWLKPEKITGDAPSENSGWKATFAAK